MTFKKIFRVKIFTVCTDKSEQLDLINTLVKVILIVLNNFHADHLLSMNIIALDSFWKRSTAQVLDHLVPSSDNRVNDNGEVFSLLKPCFLSVKHHPKVVAIEDCLVKLCRVEVIVGSWELYILREDWHWLPVLFLTLWGFFFGFLLGLDEVIVINVLATLFLFGQFFQ